MHVWDMHVRRDAAAAFEIPEGWTTAIVVLHGTVLVNVVNRSETEAIPTDIELQSGAYTGKSKFGQPTSSGQ